MDLLLRKSRIVREGERALSIRAQESRGREWADAHGYRVRKVWKENLSAWSDTNRPVYDAAMADLALGEAAALWCYAMDRFSRRGAEAVVPILGTRRVIFDYERLDSMDQRDRRWIIDRAEHAREFSERLSFNVGSTKAQLRREGRWGKALPFGLRRTEDKRAQPDRRPYFSIVESRETISRWDVVTRIYTNVSAGTGGRATARTLNAESWPSPTGGRWTAAGVRNIIRHPAYRGWLTEGPTAKARVARSADGDRIRGVAADTLPEMISEETAARAGAVLSGMLLVAAQQPGSSGHPAHPLSARLRCISCRGSLAASGQSYRCVSYIGGACEDPASVYRPAIERWVGQKWVDRISAADPGDPVLHAAAERLTARRAPQETAAVQEARAALTVAETALERLAEDRAAGAYDGVMGRHFPRLVAEAEEAHAVARQRVTDLTPDTLDVGALLQEELTEEAWQRADTATRRDLVGLLIDHILVRPAGGRSGPFDGDARCVIVWAQPDTWA